MIVIDIPGRDCLEIEHVLLDYNGTIAIDGAVPDDTATLIKRLAEQVHVAVLTADTYGTAQLHCDAMGVQAVTFPRAGASEFKQDYARGLSGGIACLGNGFNDIDMFDQADLPIAVLDAEGMCASLVSHAHIVVRSGNEGLLLLLNPDRIRATLRS